MVTDDELAARPANGSGPNLVELQERKVEDVLLVRCPTCNGLRGVNRRHVTRHNGTCGECRAGRVVTRERFYDFWLEQFTPDEIKEMGQAIDAILCLRIR